MRTLANVQAGSPLPPGANLGRAGFRASCGPSLTREMAFVRPDPGLELAPVVLFASWGEHGVGYHRRQGQCALSVESLAGRRLAACLRDGETVEHRSVDVDCLYGEALEAMDGDPKEVILGLGDDGEVAPAFVR